MSAKKPPRQPPERPSGSDDAPTTIYDSGELPARRRPQPTAKGSAPPEKPTIIERPRPAAVQAVSKKEQSAPIQAISMKTPGNATAADANPPTPMLPRPKLRAVSEAKPAQQAQNFGTIAQPYDPKEARARAMREYVIWGCVAVILASAIALVVWFVAR